MSLARASTEACVCAHLNAVRSFLNRLDSPFGKRCTGIHDSRVTSSCASQSWLPHTETQGNTIATDINVDALHQKRLHTVLYDNPFGDQFTLVAPPPSSSSPAAAVGTWDDLYGLVCGDATDPDGWIASGSSNKRGSGSRHSIHPIYKLQIALKLRDTDADWQYKYRPQHVVHDELCMVLQKRAFRVVSNDGASHNSNSGGASPLRQTASSVANATSSVTEISLSAHNPRMASHILVHEIAFGPDSDPSVRGVALWFNIAERNVTVCTPQQAKRFRWKKPGSNGGVASKRSGASNGDAEDSTDGSRHNNSDNNSYNASNNSNGRTKPSVFDSGSIDSFAMIRPHDDAAFRLATDMMKHRLAFLKRERMSSMKDRFEALKKLERQEVWLKERFQSHRKMWLHWAWPVNVGRGMVDYNTPVPPVEGPYILASLSDESANNRHRPSSRCESISDNEDLAPDPDRFSLGVNVHRIWDSLIVTCMENATEYPADNSSQVRRRRTGRRFLTHRILPRSLTHTNASRRCSAQFPDRLTRHLSGFQFSNRSLLVGRSTHVASFLTLSNIALFARTKGDPRGSKSVAGRLSFTSLRLHVSGTSGT